MNSFQGMENALVNFVATGRLEFGSLVDSILADLARIAIQVRRYWDRCPRRFPGRLGGAFGGGTNAPLSLPVSLPPGAPSAWGFADGGYIHRTGHRPIRFHIGEDLERRVRGELRFDQASICRLLKAINSAPRFQNGGPGLSTPGGSGRAIHGRGLRGRPAVWQGEDAPQVERRRSPDGGEIINVTIRDAVDSNIRSGRHDAAMRSRFGTRPSISSR